MKIVKTKPDLALLRRFGAKLRQLRQERNFSQAQLAKKVKLGSRTVFLYEQGRMSPSIEVIARLARFFQVTADELIFDEAAHLKTLQDRDLVECLTQADQLPRCDRALIKQLVELLLAKHEAAHAQDIAA